MKFNPTLPLALALSFGAAGAVMAQTAATQTPTAMPSTPSTGYSQPATTHGQPQADAAQSQTGYGQTPNAASRTPSATAQTQPARPMTAAPSVASRTAVNGNEEVRMAQQRLHAAGLYNGPEDGIMDPDTRAAVARYQEQHGLRRTESLDASTLASLESGQTTGFGSTTAPAATTPRTPGGADNPSAGAMGNNAGKSTTR